MSTIDWSASPHDTMAEQGNRLWLKSSFAWTKPEGA
jgi:hypothetical protein